MPYKDFIIITFNIMHNNLRRIIDWRRCSEWSNFTW